MEQLPKIAQQRLKANPPAGDHLDPNLLTAFVENSLTERERRPVLAHLAGCAECRELASLALPQLEEEHVAVAAAAAAASPVAASPPNRARAPFPWPGKLNLSWAALAACAVIAVAIFTYQARQRKQTLLASRQAAPAASQGEVRNAPQAAPTPASAQPEQLTAKLESPRAQGFRPNVATPKDSGTMARRDLRRSMNMNKSFEMSANDAENRPGAAASAAAGAPAAAKVRGGAFAGNLDMPAQAADQVASANATELKKQPAESSSAKSAEAGRMAVPITAMAENKAAAASAPPPGPAAPRPNPAEQTLDLASPSPFTHAKVGATRQASAMQKEGLASLSANLPARWTISSDGEMLLRSLDAGRSWDVINIADGVVFRVVATLGPEVWVGGNAGALYHSVDYGQRWSKVNPSAAGAALSSDVVSIDLSGAQVKLTTAGSQVWTTSDRGQSWQKP
jgi:hypothetical protein